MKSSTKVKKGKTKKVVKLKSLNRSRKKGRALTEDSLSDGFALANELGRIGDIKDEILDFLRFRSDYFIIDDGGDFFVVAKFAKLAIKDVFNSQGFQPLDRVSNVKECLLRVIKFGDDPPRGSLGYLLIRGGCPIVWINTKYDVEEKLGG